MKKAFGFVKYFRKKHKAKDLQKAVDKISAVELMIDNKYMVVDPEKYHVAMLDNLWSMYEGERLIAFCENLKYYCDIKNAYAGAKVDKKANLLVSLKYEDDTVKPYAYFDGKEIHLYK